MRANVIIQRVLKSGQAAGRSMKFGLVSRTVAIDGRRTTLKLDQVFWETLGEISESEGLTIHELISLVDHRRHNESRTSAVRAFIVTYLLKLASEKGSLRKGTVSSVLSG